MGRVVDRIVAWGRTLNQGCLSHKRKDTTGYSASPADRAKACQCLRDALDKVPDSTWAVIDMSLKASEALRLVPDYASAYSVKALAYTHAGKFDFAQMYNDRAFALEKDCELARRVQLEIDKQKALEQLTSDRKTAQIRARARRES